MKNSHDSKKYLLVLLFLYAAVRLPLMLSPLEIISDDIYRGMVAMEVLEGLRLPLWNYMADSYGGGAVLAGLWTVPIFKVLGPTMFALKMGPFLWHLLSLIAWYFVWREHFSPKQTFFILLFFVVPPPRITEYTLLNNGYHFEMILWMALSILVFRRFVQGKFSQWKAGILLGLLGGFSCWTILTNLATVMVIWVYVILLKEPKIRKFQFFGIYLLFFLIGFSPWWLYNWHYGWHGLDIVEYFFSVGNPAAHLSHNVPYVLQRGLRGLFGFREFWEIPRRFFMEGYTFIYVASLFYLIWRKRRTIFGLNKNFDIETFGLFFQCLLFSLAMVTESAAREYYLFPMVPFFGMTLVVAATRLGKRMQIGLALFCISAGVLGNISLIKFRDFGATLSMKGYSYITLAEVFEATFGKNFPLFREKVDILMQGRPKFVQRIFYSSLPSSAMEIQSKEQIYNYLDFIENIETDLQPILYEKIGFQMGLFCDFQPQKLKDLLEEFQISPLEFPQIYRGMVKGLNWTGYDMAETLHRAFPICEGAPLVAKPFCYEGLGELADPDFIPSKVANHQKVSNRIDAEFRPYYLMGIGKYFATEFIVEPKRVVSLFSDLRIEDAKEQEWFFKGLAKGLALDEFPFLLLDAARYVPEDYQKFFVFNPESHYQ